MIESPYVVPTYIVYLLVSTAVTIWVAHTLHKSGRVFLVEAFHGNDTLADSVNHLLVVGFYLINLGWIVMTLQTQLYLANVRQSMELLSSKVGTVLFVLGLMHMFNVYLFNRFRRRALESAFNARVPMPPTHVPAPEAR